MVAHLTLSSGAASPRAHVHTLEVSASTTCWAVVAVCQQKQSWRYCTHQNSQRKLMTLIGSTCTPQSSCWSVRSDPRHYVDCFSNEICGLCSTKKHTWFIHGVWWIITLYVNLFFFIIQVFSIIEASGVTLTFSSLAVGERVAPVSRQTGTHWPATGDIALSVLATGVRRAGVTVYHTCTQKHIPCNSWSETCFQFEYLPLLLLPGPFYITVDI